MNEDWKMKFITVDSDWSKVDKTSANQKVSNNNGCHNARESTIVSK